MRTRLLFTAAVMAGALAAPASANAAVVGIANPKPCFGANDVVGLGGVGFIPGAPLSLARDGAPITGTVAADAAGNFLVGASVPQIPTKVATSTYTASDGTNAAAAPPVKLSRLGVTMRPAEGNPNRPRRISARGFTFKGKTLFAHRVRNRKSKNIKIGGLKGDCKTASASKRLFAGAPLGTYRLQFDTFRRYRSSRRQRFVFKVRVFRTVRRSSAAAAAAGAFGLGTSGLGTSGLESGSVGQSWERIR
ncbi:MAG: hypothetical protein ACR2LH_01255 [Thermoleophilaceae bacterium]